MLALLLCLIAGVLAIYGYLRWLRNEKAMRLKQDLPLHARLAHYQYDFADGCGRSDVTGAVCRIAAKRGGKRTPAFSQSEPRWPRLRTLLGYGALIALAIKHNWHRTGAPFWISIVVLALVAIILWRYTRSRNLMDVSQNDFAQPKAVRDKFLIALGRAVVVTAVCGNPHSTNFAPVGRVRRSRHPA